MNVPLLILLGSTADQMDLSADLAEIDPVSRPEVDSQLRNSLTNRLNVSKITLLKAIDAIQNKGLGLRIQPGQPFTERLPTIFLLANQNLSGNRFHIRLRAKQV